MANKGTCKAEACERDVVGRGYCKRHYKMWREGKLPKARYKTCRAENCRKKQVSRGRCEQHQKNKPAEPTAAAAS